MTRILAILLIVSFAGNLYLGLLLLDAGIVLDNAQSVADQLWDRRKVALHIMRRDWIGRSAEEVDDLARERPGCNRSDSKASAAWGRR
jgi:hypothetical protein